MLPGVPSLNHEKSLGACVTLPDVPLAELSHFSEASDLIRYAHFSVDPHS
jgi:hypothetical protein